jgi:hypothetical protein
VPVAVTFLVITTSQRSDLVQMKIHAGSYTGPHMHICRRPRKLLVNCCSPPLTAHLACKPAVYAPSLGPATITAVRGNWGRTGLSVLSALSDNERGPVEEELRLSVDSSNSEKQSAEEISVHPEDLRGETNLKIKVFSDSFGSCPLDTSHSACLKVML